MSEVKDYFIKTQSQIERLLEDPITKILLNNSLISTIQLETLLIDLLSEDITGYSLKYEDKAKLRLNEKSVSRGSFNRTLKQANKNINKSINTVFLLGYLGIFKTPQLQPFIEVSNNLNRYIKKYTNLWKKQNTELIDNHNIEEISLLKYELEERLKRFLTK